MPVHKNENAKNVKIHNSEPYNRIFVSKFNRVIYSSTPKGSPSFKALAQIPIKILLTRKGWRRDERADGQTTQKLYAFETLNVTALECVPIPHGELLWSPPTPLGKLTRNLVGSIRATCTSKVAKIVLIGNPRLPPWPHLEKIFFTSSPEPKGQLTWNLEGSIRATCRTRIAKIVMIGNSRWPPVPPFWKSIFRFFSWTERPTDLILGRKHRGDL